MANLKAALVHGNPSHFNFKEPAARNFEPGEFEVDEAAAMVNIIDSWALIGQPYAGVRADGQGVFHVANPGYVEDGNPATKLQDKGDNVYIQKTTPAGAFNPETNPYSTVVYAAAANTVFVGRLEKDVMETDMYIRLLFTAEALEPHTNP